MKTLTKNSIIGVLGAGAMGAGIAQIAATNGHSTFLYDNNSKALESAGLKLQKILNRLVEKERITEQESKDIFGRIEFSDNLNTFKDCDLVIEAIIENLEIKQSVFQKLESITKEDAILATNTSSISVISIASAVEKQSRVMGIHFFNPAPLMPLVEIVPCLSSDMEIVLEAKKLIDSWGKKTVLAKDTPAFIVNRVARPFYAESIKMYEEGVADFATIDWAMKEIGGFRMGPFELMDFIGNDVNYKVTETVYKQFFYDSRFRPSLTQRMLFEANRLGRKTKIGYYDYHENATKPEPTKDVALGKKIVERTVAMLINQATDALFMNVATKEDLDLAMTKGVNYPKGLLQWADDLGLENVLKTLQDLQEEFGEERYRACPLLKRMVKSGDTFY